jgi:hypothetical protein
MEVSVPLAALSERTSSHNLGAGAERHLRFGFGSIQYKKTPTRPERTTLGRREEFEGMEWRHKE